MDPADAAEHPPGTKHSSHRLEGLSDECWELITLYLPYQDLKRLELTGSHNLNAHIARSVSEIDAQMPCLSPWPFSAFPYRSLRSLAVTSDTEEDLVPFVALRPSLVPAEGHLSLESLEIKSSLARAIFPLSPGSPTLDMLLPNLKSLKVISAGFTDALMFRNLPSKLETFALALQPLDEDEEAPLLSLSVINDLPQSLTVLDIPTTLLTLQPDEPKTPSLPPALVELAIFLKGGQPLITKLPQTIRSLTLELAPSESCYLYYSELPKSLVHLVLRGSYCQLRLTADRPLAEGLETFHDSLGSTILGPGDAPYVYRRIRDYLPRSITSFQLVNANLKSHDDSLVLPLLKSLTFTAEYELLQLQYSLPPALTQLKLLTPLSDMASRCMPAALTNLTIGLINRPFWLVAFESLVNLKILVARKDSDAMPSRGFWNLMHPRLEKLTCHLSHFDSLEGLTGWKCLKKLAIGHVLPDWFKTTFKTPPSDEILRNWPKNVTLRFPATLTKLRLTVHSHWHILWHPWDYLTQLETLELCDNYTNDIEVNAAHFAFEIFNRLPSSLRRLHAPLPYAFPLETLHNLPHGLRELWLQNCGAGTRFGSFGSSEDSANAHRLSQEIWRKEHLSKLPPRLVKLTIACQHQELLDLDELLPLLPSTLLSTEIGEDECFKTRALSLFEKQARFPDAP